MTDMTELSSDKYSTFYRDERHHSVELRWHGTTATMSEADFRRGLERLVGFLKRDPAPNVLIDVTVFAYTPASDFSPWRDANIIPGYNAAGVAKFAFLVPAAAPNTVENGNAPVVESPGKFPTGYFGSREGVYNWFDTP